ncbi:unnamed protein product [Clonostachys rosea]|uniref:Uncharacterized protein n=1 Tax=Bionectria ochroleuca TaxID=29856 RepID=A0ABY6UG00_BIOOC|nr:unnamed protein product [Clonostachys rosea]
MGISHSKANRGRTPTELGAETDDELPVIPSTKETKRSTGGKVENDKSAPNAAKPVERGDSVSGSEPKLIQNRTRGEEVDATTHHSCPTARRLSASLHRRCKSDRHLAHSSRQAADDYFSYHHNPGSGISWSDKAYDRASMEGKKKRK